MSAVDRLLSALDVGVEPFAICDVRAGQPLALPPCGFVSVHYVLAGRGTLAARGGRRLAFAPETIVVCPAGLGHTVEVTAASGPTRCVPPAEGLEWLASGHGGGGAQVLLACGRVRAQLAAGIGLFDGLGAPLAEDFADEPEVQTAVRALLGELAAPGLGARAAVESLMKFCVVRLLRRLAQRGDGRLPLLAALGEPRLAAAVGAMLAHPERRHSLDDLAAAAGMSRSAFAQRFRAAFGAGPHAFLTGRRLQRAARMLETTGLPVKTVAGHVGFRSRSHFSRAFKARYGLDPAAYRARAGAPPPG